MLTTTFHLYVLHSCSFHLLRLR